ncbi:MAG: hypothetical protein ACYCW6_28600 [Candidatus Xenobia bacterium]
MFAKCWRTGAAACMTGAGGPGAAGEELHGVSDRMGFLLRWTVFALLVAALCCAGSATVSYMVATDAAASVDTALAWIPATARPRQDLGPMMQHGQWQRVEGWAIANSKTCSEAVWLEDDLLAFERAAVASIVCLLLIPALGWFSRQVHAEEQHG